MGLIVLANAEARFATDSFSAVQVGFALIVWVIGVVLAWLISKLLHDTLCRGGNIARIANVARRVTFYGLLAGLLIACLDLAGVGVRFESVWTYPVIGSGESVVRISNIVLAVIIVLAGIVISHLIARMIGRRLHTLRLDRTSADALQKAIFYLLLIVVVLSALQAMRIPISSFAFLGGAAAIGVGFGAQNVINNFISGWILISERPVRIDDLIEIEGQPGRVEHIGARCTRIRRTDGIDMLVPNSTLLENTVINWTLIDDEIRVKVTVGVVYGSPTDLVARLILQAVQEQKDAIAKPEPIVIFEDFGDNALIFEAHFWTHARGPMDVKKMASAVRFRIDALCRENSIVIAFPQRDVHLDTLRPLEVRLTATDDSRGASPSSSAPPTRESRHEHEAQQ